MNDTKDALRYRWLRQRLRVRKARTRDQFCITVHLNTDYTITNNPQYISEKGFDLEMAVLDQAIDAAIKEEKS
jgi:hypothetical protein